MTIPTTPPGTHLSAAKAYAGAAVAAIGAFLGVVFTGLDDEIVTQQEWVGATIAALVVLGGVFGSVYAVPNKLVQNK